MIEHLAAELEKLTEEIEGGSAPFDQQQKLQIDFMMKRVEHLEETHEKIRNDIMDLIHSNSNIPAPSANSHQGH
jgi:archaellum component FlaC